MSRKAQGLPLNTVILAILVVLVLLVVGAFFLGGTSGISKTIRGIFYGSTAGQDRVFAVQTCNQRCDSLKLLPTSALPDSAYCKQTFSIDTDNNGEAEFVSSSDPKQYIKYYCHNKKSIEPTSESLDAPCVLDNGDGPDKFCVSGYKPTIPKPTIP
ncbi:MAG TPA: hypothetical protein VJH37_00070 [Candidatus Nanoarchaeia archaeon]|nr:hypothetical protein [Candidatus Nanoarchaeia archaeon]